MAARDLPNIKPILESLASPPVTNAVQTQILWSAEDTSWVFLVAAAFDLFVLKISTFWQFLYAGGASVR